MLKLNPEPKVLLVDFSTTVENLKDGKQDSNIYSISGTKCYADELVMKKSTNVWGRGTDIYALAWSFEDILRGGIIRPKEHICPAVKITKIDNFHKLSNEIINLDLFKSSDEGIQTFMNDFLEMINSMKNADYLQRPQANDIVNKIQDLRNKKYANIDLTSNPINTESKEVQRSTQENNMLKFFNDQLEYQRENDIIPK